MIGFVRAPPTITVERYEPARLAIVESCDRQQLLQAIAAHLFLASRRICYGMSLRDMYAGKVKPAVKAMGALSNATRTREAAGS